MLKYLIALLLSGLLLGCRSKDQLCIGIYNNDLGMMIYEQTDKMPFYKNGTVGAFTRLTQIIPADTMLTAVNLEFIVLPDGKISNFQVYGMNNTKLNIEEKSLETIKMDTWIPGECNHQNVAVKMRFPLKLDFQE